MPVILAASPNVVISEVSPEGSSASHEFIELYNNSQGDVSLDGWTIQIRSASNSLNRTISLSNQLEGQGYGLLASTSHLEACSVSDFACFSSSMATTGGHVFLLDGAGELVDKLGWGSAVSPEQIAAPAPQLSMSVVRRPLTNNATLLQDTDNNSIDFISASSSPTAGGVYDATTAVDLCPNLVGMQETIPSGYELAGDICQEIPVVEPEATCLGVYVSEIVPNPSGDDTGNEFIELYNETSNPVDLTGCTLRVGATTQALSGLIEPGYRAFYGLILPNAAGGQVHFTTRHNMSIVTYPADMSDDESYGVINGVWLQGLVPTPNAVNLAVGSATETPVVEGEELAACAPGKYRSPETNRCRNIEVEAGLMACDSGQERNPETNRCRKVAPATTSLAPCAADQVRNPETNRCRKIDAVESTAKPCPEGQERNAETNRCRKVASAKTTNPLANPAKASTKPVSYYVLGIVAALGIAYAGYEYRQSIYNFFSRLRQRV